MLIERIAKRVLIIQRIYLLLTLSAISEFVFVRSLENASPAISGDALFFVVLAGTTYVGLKRQRSWVVPLIMITSVYALIQTVIMIMEPALSMTAFVIKAARAFILFFYWYQANFFSRREVREYFRAQGTVLF